MLQHQRWLLPFFTMAWVAGITGGACYAQTDPLQKDIDDHLADLHQAKAGLDASQMDLTTTQKALSFTQDFNERQVLFARINKDRSEIQTYTAQALGDLNFLQFQWSSLTQEQKDYVVMTRQSFT